MSRITEQIRNRIRACWQAQVQLHDGYVNHYVVSGREAAAALETQRHALHWSDDRLVGEFVPDRLDDHSPATRPGDDSGLWT